MTHTALTACLACGGTNLTRYLDLGEQPLANAFHDDDAVLPTFPLGLQYCPDCWHSQNLVAVDPDLMFKDYPYVSGTSDTLRTYLSAFARAVYDETDSRMVPRVLEIASNDGTLLKVFADLGCDVLGVDPAENLRALSAAKGVDTIVGYWDDATVAQLGTKRFDVIVAMNVVAHTADPLSFLKLCKQVLAPGGRVFIQTSQARMIENGEFDTVYHEHHSFFTVSSFCALANRSGLEIDHIAHVPIHGTSYLAELVDPRDGLHPRFAEDFLLGLDERSRAYYAPALYTSLQGRADVTADWVRNTIALSREQGFRVVGYGAAAKAMTFLNFAGIDLDLIIDDNPLKIGKLTPGRNIVVWSIDDISLNSQPVLFVVLAWNFYDEIVGRIKGVRNKPRDRFLTYFPKVKLE